jgi:hypothetical protein
MFTVDRLQIIKQFFLIHADQRGGLADHGIESRDERSQPIVDRIVQVSYEE